ncbi:hypothetical protein D5086_005904 [Populus alba]|uniref:Uncharacterized protein n=1 Tax=Populus alba TaxID=43335 RepID=A0ACC4CVS2_POPAL
MEQHSNPYKVGWITDNHSVMVQHRCLSSFSLENHFQDENKRLVLEPLPIKEFRQKSTLLITPQEFQQTLAISGILSMFICKATTTNTKDKNEGLPTALQQVLQQFKDVFLEELPSQLPPPRDVQHVIDLVPGSSLPNLPYYRMSPAEHEEL